MAPVATAKVKDGYIEGVLHADRWRCGRCKAARCVTIRIVEVTLPDGIEVSRTILKGCDFIGVTCGCYAKFHRQVAHIQEAMRRGK